MKLSYVNTCMQSIYTIYNVNVNFLMIYNTRCKILKALILRARPPWFSGGHLVFMSGGCYDWHQGAFP